MHKRKTFHEDNKFLGDSSGVIFCSSMGGRCPWWRILDFSWYMVASGPQRPRLANQEANGFRSFIFPYMLHFIYLMIYIYIYIYIYLLLKMSTVSFLIREQHGILMGIWY